MHVNVMRLCQEGVGSSIRISIRYQQLQQRHSGMMHKVCIRACSSHTPAAVTRS